MGKERHPAWTPKGGKPDFDDYRKRYPDRDVYFDLEYLGQVKSHEGNFDDDDWQLITAISAVVEGKRHTLVSLYEETDTVQPPVAIDQKGEIKVIKAFLTALFKWRSSHWKKNQERLSGDPETDAPVLRLFNYSGSSAEGRLWKKVEILNAKGYEVIPESQSSEQLRSLLEYISGTSSHERSGRSYGEGIERFDLGRVIRRSFQAFPLNKNSKHGLKVVERFLPSFSRTGSLVGSEDSIATWVRIKMLKEEMRSLPNWAEDQWARIRSRGNCDINARDEKVADGLRWGRLNRELERLEDSYLTYAEWDCRAVYFLHKHLIALDRSAGAGPNSIVLGARATTARRALIIVSAE